MSAEILRRAAEGMRGEYETDPYRLGQTMRATADWLDATAVRIDAGRDPRHGGRRNHSWRGSREALAVARAYLGEDA